MFTRILVATDFSQASDAALDYAKGLAATLGASLHLVHVVDDPIASGGFGAEAYIGSSPEYGDALRAEAERRLAGRLTPAERRDLRATTDVLGGTVAATIVEMAISRAADLIVMGTHGRTGLAHALMGSVAERVVRTAECPVLTVRTAPRRSPAFASALIPRAVTP
jgi:nucleotide-binding universal stress UspA family protein